MKYNEKQLKKTDETPRLGETPMLSEIQRRVYWYFKFETNLPLLSKKRFRVKEVGWLCLYF